jgi:hypothetical protein
LLDELHPADILVVMPCIALRRLLECGELGDLFGRQTQSRGQVGVGLECMMEPLVCRPEVEVMATTPDVDIIDERLELSFPLVTVLPARLRPRMAMGFSNCAARPKPGGLGPFITPCAPHPSAAVATMTSTRPTCSPSTRP